MTCEASLQHFAAASRVQILAVSLRWRRGELLSTHWNFLQKESPLWSANHSQSVPQGDPYRLLEAVFTRPS